MPGFDDALFALTGAIILSADQRTVAHADGDHDVLTLELEDGRRFQVMSGSSDEEDSFLTVIEVT